MDIEILKTTPHTMRDGTPCLFTTRSTEGTDSVCAKINLRVTNNNKSVAIGAFVAVRYYELYETGQRGEKTKFVGSPFRTDEAGRVDVDVLVPVEMIRGIRFEFEYDGAVLTCGFLPPKTQDALLELPPSFTPRRTETRPFGPAQETPDSGAIPLHDIGDADSVQIAETPIINGDALTEDNDAVPIEPLQMSISEDPMHKATLPAIASPDETGDNKQGDQAEASPRERFERILDELETLRRQSIQAMERAQSEIETFSSERAALSNTIEDWKAMLAQKESEIVKEKREAEALLSEIRTIPTDLSAGVDQAFARLQSLVSDELTGDEVALNEQHRQFKERIEKITTAAWKKLNTDARELAEKTMAELMRKAGDKELRRERNDRIKGIAFIAAGLGIAIVYAIIRLVF